MHTLRHRLATVLVLVLCGALAAGCTISKSSGDSSTGSGSIKPIAALQGAQIKVGSKEFDEQLMLGQIAIVALRAAGANPVDKTNITGSSNVRRALTSGAIDLYWEYTGTGWVSFLGKDKTITDPKALYDAVKRADTKNKVTWWARSPGNNTYAIAVNRKAQKRTGVKTLSDYAALVKRNPAAASTCAGPEFKSRDDGLPGLQKAYGFTLPGPQLHVVNDAVVYPTAGKGETCSFGSVASTDGRIPANDLVVLRDDKRFFPIYNPAITIRSQVADKYPQLQRVFASIAAKLDSKTLTSLNRKVSVDGKDPNTVAGDWLASQGFTG